MFFLNYNLTPHPFTKSKRTELVKESDPVPEDIIDTTWGKNKVVKVKHKVSEDGEEWDMQFNAKDRVLPSQLDQFDLNVIADKNVNRINYKLVKPFVLTGDFSNAEIALALSRSKSWVERIAPRVKEAIKHRKMHSS